MALSDYQRIEYVEGQTNGYLNTGQTVNRNTWIRFEGFINPSGTQYIYGAVSSGKNYSFRYSTDNSYKWRYVSNTDYSYTTAAYSDLLSFSQFVNIDISTVQSKLDNVTQSTYEFNYATYSGSANTSVNMYLLARNNNGTADNFAIGSRLTYFSLYDMYNDVELIELYPVREKGVLTPRVGMYDIVNDTVIWSSGSSGLIAGPDLSAGVNARIKVGGSWEDGTPYIKVNGSWETASALKIKVNGSWEDAV